MFAQVPDGNFRHLQALCEGLEKLGSPDSDRDKRLQRPLCCHYTTPQSIGWEAPLTLSHPRRIAGQHGGSGRPGYWQVVVLLLPVPGGVQSVSREMCQPESEMSNR